MPPTPPMQLSADDVKCLEILHLHGVDSRKLEKLVDQSVNQADAILAEYAKNLEGGIRTECLPSWRKRS